MIMSEKNLSKDVVLERAKAVVDISRGQVTDTFDLSKSHAQEFWKEGKTFCQEWFRLQKSGLKKIRAAATGKKEKLSA
tara:strand:+ start:540 stop:773 length:234 start_codon:yes stop_codon:yes gene_type:complete